MTPRNLTAHFLRQEEPSLESRSHVHAVAVDRAIVEVIQHTMYATGIEALPALHDELTTIVLALLAVTGRSLRDEDALSMIANSCPQALPAGTTDSLSACASPAAALIRRQLRVAVAAGIVSKPALQSRRAQECIPREQSSRPSRS